MISKSNVTLLSYEVFNIKRYTFPVPSWIRAGHGHIYTENIPIPQRGRSARVTDCVNPSSFPEIKHTTNMRLTIIMSMWLSNIGFHRVPFHNTRAGEIMDPKTSPWPRNDQPPYAGCAVY